jgi:fumarate reductase subunit C
MKNPDRKLFVAQRLTAMLLGPLVVIHLGLILVAVRGGLSGAEILDRTQGSLVWAAFYLLFVVAAGIHAPIGMRNILNEWTSWPHKMIDVICAALFALFLCLGLRAVIAVVWIQS